LERGLLKNETMGKCIMDEIIKVIRAIKKAKITEPEKVSNLIGKLQVLRDTSAKTINPDLILFGIATGLEKISDYRIFELQNDDRLNELNTKIRKVEEREGLGENEEFVHKDADTPEDYQSLNIEFEYRIGEIRTDIMKKFDENKIAYLFWNDRKEYIKKFYTGWRVLEKDNPGKLREIDEDERLEIEELR
jgi:hypothetical protein